MPTPFDSTGFAVLSVVPRTAAVLRVRFTYDPKLVDDDAGDDGLNPLNYTLSGSHLSLVTSCQPVGSDPQAVDLYLNVPLATGQWALSVAAVVETSDGTALGSTNTTLFDVTNSLAVASPNGGATTDGPLETLQRHLPFEGPNWDALVAAIATGDQANLDNAKAWFHQLHLASASAGYLDRRAAARGVDRPVNVGMSDVLFRQLAIRMSTQLTTAQSLWELLEIFYGVDTVCANMDSVAEPFALLDGWSTTLWDGRSEVEVFFNEAEFERIGEASAVEVAVAITRACRRAGSTLHAEAVAAPETSVQRVRLRNKARGLGSVVEVRGGLAQNALGFPTAVEAPIPAGSVFTISAPEPGVGRYSITSVAGTPLLLVREGDYVNLTCPAFHADNRGTFAVTAVRTVWGGASYTQYFEVENDDAVAEAGIATLADADIQFFRPTRARVGGSYSPVVANNGEGGFSVVLPATTQLVGRNLGTAAYLQPRQLVDITSVVMRDEGLAKVTTGAAHGLTAGDRVLLDELVPAMTAPATVAGVPSTTGNPGTTDAAQTALWSSLRSDLAAREDHAATLLSTDDVLLVGGFEGAGSTYLATASRFRTTAEATLSSGAAEGRPQYTYNWIATASLGAGKSQFTLDGLFGTLAERALIAGGLTGAGAVATCQLYSASDNTWANVPNGALTARYGHKSVRIEDVNGDDLVYLTYGLSDPTTTLATIQMFSSTAGGTISTLTSPAGQGRHRHAVVATGARSFVVVGGATLPGPVALTSSVAYNQATDTFSTIGPLGLARYDHALVKLRDDVVMAIGGKGRNVVNETADRVLAECEILDVSQGRWRPAGKLSTPRQNPQAFVVGGKVYVSGGLDAAGAIVTKTDVYDIRTGRWSTLPATATVSIQPGCAAALTADGLILEHGGALVEATPTSTARLFVPGAQIISPRISANREAVVAEVLSATTFEYESPTGQAAQLGVGVLEKTKAAESEFIGPYIWDPAEGLAITSTSTTLDGALIERGRYRVLTVDSTEGFPDEEGWLVLAFGTSNEVGPIKYLGVGSDTELVFDYSIQLPKAIPDGATVILLSQRDPYVPEDASLGAFYLTASAAGRVAAEKFLGDAMAEGIAATTTVVYPSDKGLAGEGLPVSGVRRLSDKVLVWGGDNVDADLELARGDS